MKGQYRIRFFIISVVFLVTLILVISLFALPIFKITAININGLDNLNRAQIEEMITANIGDNIFTFSTSKSRKNILANNYVEDVKVKRELPNMVLVELQEYKLRGYVPYMGSYLYINDYGLVLDVQKEMSKQRPVVEGLSFKDFTVGEILNVENPSTFDTMVDLSKLFDKYELLGDVVRVDVTDVNNIHLYVDRIDVEFGSFDDANRKMLTFIEILKQLDKSYPGVLNLTGANATFQYMT